MDDKHFKIIKKFHQNGYLMDYPAEVDIHNAQSKMAFRDRLFTYCLRGGILYDKRNDYGICVPRSQVLVYIAFCHQALDGYQPYMLKGRRDVMEGLNVNVESLAQEHYPFDETLAILKELFYWDGMKDDVQEFCRNCTYCSKEKQSSPTNTEKVLLKAKNADMEHDRAPRTKLYMKMQILIENKPEFRNLEEGYSLLPSVMNLKHFQRNIISTVSYHLKKPLPMYANEVSNIINSVCSHRRRSVNTNIKYSDLLQVSKNPEHTLQGTLESNKTNYAANLRKMLIDVSNDFLEGSDKGFKKADNVAVISMKLLEKITLVKHQHLWLTNIVLYAEMPQIPHFFAEYPGEAYLFDRLGPFDNSHSTKTFLHVAIDLFSACFIANASDKCKIDDRSQLESLISSRKKKTQYIFTTDSRSAISLQLLSEFTTDNDIQHYQVSVGLVRHFTRFLEVTCESYASDPNVDWSAVVSGPLKTYNTTKHPLANWVPYLLYEMKCSTVPASQKTKKHTT